MEQKGSTPTQVLRRQMPAIRARLDDLSAQGLADRITSLGGKLDRAAISKIENGVRNVTLDEALMIAVALDVAPVHLFIPKADDAWVELAPAMSVHAVSARAWVRGEQPLPGTNEKTFRVEVPDTEWRPRPSPRELAAMQAQEQAQEQAQVAETLIEILSEHRNKPPTTIGPGGLRDHLQQIDRRIDMAYTQLARARVAQKKAADNGTDAPEGRR